MTTPSELPSAFSAHLARTGLVRSGDSGLVCVSGGADSTALLLLLAGLPADRRPGLAVLHFDHGLRPESGRDAEHVAQLAERLGLPFQTRRGFEPPASGKGIQAAAREWRRRHAETLAARRGAAWIATGHQRDDHLETLLLKFLRGAHLSHLMGMRAQSGIWVRPLLPFRAETLRAFLRNSGASWLEDTSNKDPKYRRNRVRHELLPLLDDLAAGALERRLDALERQSLQLAEWLERQPLPSVRMPQELGVARPALDRQRLAEAPTLVATHWVSRFLSEQGCGAVDFEVLEAAARLAGEEKNWSLDLPGRHRLRGSGEHVWLETTAADPQSLQREAIAGLELTYPHGWTVRVTPLAEPAAGCTPSGGMVLHACPEHACLEVRPWTAGDRFHPPGRHGPVKLGEFLRARGIRGLERETTAVILLDGQIAAVYPHMVARGHARNEADGRTVHVLIRRPSDRAPAMP